MERTFSFLLSQQSFPRQKMAFVVGPRQVGKTTLAQQLQEQRNSPHLYRNWDDLHWRRELSRSPYGFLEKYAPKKGVSKPLVVLDEIHKYPRWKQYLKGLWDTKKNLVDILVTGSGRLNIYQRGGDSLLGRYHQYRLHPLSVREILSPSDGIKNYRADDILKKWNCVESPASEKTRDIFKKLLRWGGFPHPFLAKSKNEHRLWLKERRQLLVKEDLRDLTRIQLLSHVEELVELLVLRAGNILSYNSLREDLQVALDSVRLWTNALQNLYFIYLIRPFSGKIQRALKREPKVYLWDWSEISDEGVRFENMMANHLLKWCHFTEDWGYEPLELHFVRDKEKREVDFLLTKEKKPWALIETKLSDTAPSLALHYFAKKLGITNKFLVVRDLKQPGKAGDTTVIDAANFCVSLPV